MKQFKSRSAVAVTMAAVLTMVASPVLARDWGHGRHHRGRLDVDAGDVLAGVLILGGIAAIASASSKSSREKREREDTRYPDTRYPETRYPDRDDSGRYGNERDDRGGYGGATSSGMSSSGMGMAVDTCVGEVERGRARVDSVDNVDRDTGGDWRVDGRMDDGKSFACTVDNSGRVRSATVDGRAAI